MIHLRAALHAIVITLAMATAACTNMRGTPSLGGALESTRWTLVEIAGQPVQTADTAHRPWIRFEKSGGIVTGSGGCNGFGGKYTLSDSSLAITDVISTMRACVESALNAREQRYFAGLRSVDYFTIANDTLTLHDVAAQPPQILRFIR